jgi:hypothetical protein
LEHRKEMTSPYLEEVAREAQVRAARETLADYIGGRLGTAIPKDITKRLDSEPDIERLRRWIPFIVKASSFDELRILLDT